jgi:hypothetical protein
VQNQDESMLNVREVESLFISELLVADWKDSQGNGIPPCGINEAEAIAKMMIGNMQKQALTPDAFLIHLAALAGGSILQRGVKAIITRTEDTPGISNYTCKWGLRYGTFKGSFSMTGTVPHSSWKKQKTELGAATTIEAEQADAQHWKKKYEDLLLAVKTNHEQSTDLRLSVLSSLKGSG